MARLAFHGQARVFARLRAALASGRLGHALLFVGPEGVGKRQVALALAQVLECELPEAPAELEVPGGGDATRRHLGACGDCGPCHKVEAALHPDVRVVVAEGQQIKIAQVRALAGWLASPPHEGRWKVAVIDGADTLGEEAANALLKTLEEPRRNTQFVLTARSPEPLPATVRSRCQRIGFQPLSDAEVLALLLAEQPSDEAGAGAEPLETLEQLAREARGSIARARALRQEQAASGESLRLAQALLAASRGSAGRDPSRVLTVLDAAASARERDTVRGALEAMMRRERDSAVTRARGGQPDLAALAAERYALCAEALEALLGYASPQMTVEHLLVRLLALPAPAEPGGAP